MTRPGIDVERLAHRGVMRTLARTKVTLDQAGAIYHEMLRENRVLIREGLRATLQDFAEHRACTDCARKAKALLKAIRHAARTRQGK